MGADICHVTPKSGAYLNVSRRIGKIRQESNRRFDALAGALGELPGQAPIDSTPGGAEFEGFVMGNTWFRFN